MGCIWYRILDVGIAIYHVLKAVCAILQLRTDTCRTDSSNQNGCNQSIDWH